MSKVDSFRSVFEASLVDIAARLKPDEELCLILSGGVDTCAILEASAKVGISFGAAVTVVTGDDSPDKAFASAAAKMHKVAHYIVQQPPQELLERHLKSCVRVLETWDGMTIRNSLVVAAAFQKASELGFNYVIVGDGADELYGGYSFMWATRDAVEWKEKRDSICAKWTFATAALANMYGLTSYSPYTEKRTVDWAIRNTERSDCIGVRPIQLVHGGQVKEHETGKIILREAYDTVSSWRRKDPIEVGSGATVIGHDDYWKDILPDSEFQSEASALLERGYVIPSKEYLVNFRAFEACFGKDGSTLVNKKRLALGQGCVGCCFDNGDDMFCRMCGAYPSQRG